MIRFHGRREGREFIGIGLSRGNCEKLMKGQPIVLNAETDFGMPEVHLEILVIGGETEQAMYEELKSLGVLDGTEIRREIRREGKPKPQ